MLHMMSKIPVDRAEWMLLGSMMSMGDYLVIYQEAAEHLVGNEVALRALKELANLGVILRFRSDTIDCKLFKQHVIMQKVSWIDIVDLVASEQSVNSL